MIEAHELSKRFEDLLAVDRVNFNIQRGEVLVLLGPNGAGKTTTVRMLTSILRPTSGWARVAGFDVVKQAAEVRAHVGVLTEMHGLYGRMPADEYLDFFGELYGLTPDIRRKRIYTLLEQFGLIEAMRRKIGEYSKGMRQKLALARALLHEPPVLLLDEPTSAMDPESSRLVRDAIIDLRSSERTFIICTHNLAEAEELADQIAIIRQGRIIAQGNPTELKAQLLGPPEYEIRFAARLAERLPHFPAGVTLTAHGADWLRVRSEPAHLNNPVLVRALVEQEHAVVSLHEVPRSLEQVYLQAVGSLNGVNQTGVQ